MNEEFSRASPQSIVSTLAELRSHSARLVACTTAEIAEALSGLAESWQSETNDEVRVVAERVAETSGLSVPMVVWSIRELCRRLTLRGLEHLVEFELGVRDPFGAARQRSDSACARLAIPPAVCVHYVAGTVPSVALEVIALALLARTPILLKTSSDEPHLARAFVAALRQRAPHLADCVAVMTWRGGDDLLDAAACEGADLVVVYGTDLAVASMRARCAAGTTFIGYGNRVSCGIIGDLGDSVGPQSLRSLCLGMALDTSAYDQRGCMSPHTYFISDRSPWPIDEVADTLATYAFPSVEEALPRGRVLPETHAAIQQLRGVFEFRGSVRAAPTATILVSPETRFVGSPGARTLTLVPFTSSPDLLQALSPLGPSLSTAALLCSPQERAHLVPALARVGVRRICRPGRMQRPVLLREHDGRPRFSDWMQWVSVEPSV